jgi:hypothetical protein
MKLKRSVLRIVSAAVVVLVMQLALPRLAGAQALEASGGYTHVTSDFGTDGFNLGAG